MHQFDRSAGLVGDMTEAFDHGIDICVVRLWHRMSANKGIKDRETNRVVRNRGDQVVLQGVIEGNRTSRDGRKFDGVDSAGIEE